MNTQDTITEADIALIMESCHMTRDYAIKLLEAELRSKIEYETYIGGVLDPRD